jgi:ribose transport system substrate-binding protein
MNYMRYRFGNRFVWLLLLVASALLVAGCGTAAKKASEPLVVDDTANSTTSAETEATTGETHPMTETEATTGETHPMTETDTTTNGKVPTIALVMKTLTNPFFVEMEKGARRAEQELGINLLVRTGAQETSIEQQITIIKELISEHVDGIVIAPADSKELIPVLKEAQDAGIVIVNVDNRLDPEIMQSIGLTNVPFISVNNEQGAYLSAKYISDQVTTPSEAIILEGIRTAGNAEDRKLGAIRAFDENEHISVVAMETAHWKIDEAYNVTADLFRKHPTIKLVFCANDMMAFGTVRYLQEQGKTDVLVAAYDALDEAKLAIRNGTLQATIDQQAALQAYTGVQFAIQMINGEVLPPETLVDVLLITADNVDTQPNVE